MRFEIAAQSIVGGRSYQEDRWLLCTPDGRDATSAAASDAGVMMPNGALVVVADGMGGEGGGAAASRIVAEQFAANYFDRQAGQMTVVDRLEAALQQANAALFQAKRERTDLKARSGCTLIAGLVQDDGLHFVSVGDSSIWRFRDDEVHRVNATHENAAKLDVRAAELDTDEAWKIVLNDRQRETITAAVMGEALEPDQKQVAVRAIQEGDVLIFASDGIETASIEHLRRMVPLFLAKGSAAALARGLVRMIERLGGKNQDNTTVVVVRTLPAAGARTQIGPAWRRGETGARPQSAGNRGTGAPVPQRPRGPWDVLPRSWLLPLGSALALLAVLAVAAWSLWPASTPQSGQTSAASGTKGGTSERELRGSGMPANAPDGQAKPAPDRGGGGAGPPAGQPEPSAVPGATKSDPPPQGSQRSPSPKPNTGSRGGSGADPNTGFSPRQPNDMQQNSDSPKPRSSREGKGNQLSDSDSPAILNRRPPRPGSSGSQYPREYQPNYDAGIY